MVLCTEPSVSPDGQLVLHDGENVVRELASVSLLIGDSLDCGTGLLILTSRRLVFLPDSDRTKGYETAFYDITMHAISRDAASVRGPCIYAQIDGDFFEGAEIASTARDGGMADDNETEPETRGDDYDAFTELRFFFPHESLLQPVFQDLCDCAALNPDSDSGQDEEGPDFFYDEESALQGAGADARAAMLARLEGCLTLEEEEGEEEEEGDEEEDGQDDRFEDA